MRTTATSMEQAFVGLALPLAVACLVLAGCDAKATRSKPLVKQADASATTEKPTGPINVRTVSKEGFKEAVAKHKGKVVLVDFWATWCPPCVAQFPHTVKLSRKYKEQGLDVISVSVDEPKAFEQVRKFLTEKGADFENLTTVYGINAIGEFEVDNNGVPCYWIYDREGKLVERISPGDAAIKFTPQLIDDAIERLLKQPATSGAPETPPADPAKPSDETPPSEAAKPTEESQQNDAAKPPEAAQPNP